MYPCSNDLQIECSTENSHTINGYSTTAPPPTENKEPPPTTIHHHSPITITTIYQSEGRAHAVGSKLLSICFCCSCFCRFGLSIDFVVAVVGGGGGVLTVADDAIAAATASADSLGPVMALLFNG